MPVVAYLERRAAREETIHNREMAALRGPMECRRLADAFEGMHLRPGRQKRLDYLGEPAMRREVQGRAAEIRVARAGRSARAARAPATSFC
jgi:hypothetical protein